MNFGHLKILLYEKVKLIYTMYKIDQIKCILNVLNMYIKLIEDMFRLKLKKKVINKLCSYLKVITV